MKYYKSIQNYISLLIYCKKGYIRYRKRFEKDPIIICGCGRSGTTLLLSILSAHTGIFSIPYETNAFCPTGYDDKPDLDTPFELNKLYTALQKYDIPESCYRWCEKTPKNVLFLSRILKHFNNKVKIINIVRDGRDVVTSIVKLYPGQFAVGVKRWVTDVQAGLQFEKNSNVITIKYEDIVLKFQSTIKEILTFIEEDSEYNMNNWHNETAIRRSNAWVTEVKPVTGVSIGKWKSGKYEEQLSKIMNDKEAVKLLEYYNYI